MVTVDWPNVEESGSYTPIPEGEYLCKVIDISEKETDKGDVMWNIQYEICESGSDQEGRRFFDNMIFSESAIGRAKFICSRMGINVSKKMDLSPSDIMNREVFISLTIGSYNKENAKGEIEVKPKNVVPWDGFRGVDKSEETEEKPKDTKATIEIANKKTDKVKTKKEIDDELPF